MSKQVSASQRAVVAKRANYKCEYCKLSEEDAFLYFHIDHIVSQKHGGGNELENLAYACPQCNQHKGTDLATFLGSYQNIIPLFNPRQEEWSAHFKAEAGEIIPKTEIGEATVKLLRLNEPERIVIRQILQDIGQYP